MHAGRKVGRKSEEEGKYSTVGEKEERENKTWGKDSFLRRYKPCRPQAKNYFWRPEINHPGTVFLSLSLFPLFVCLTQVGFLSFSVRFLSHQNSFTFFTKFRKCWRC